MLLSIIATLGVAKSDGVPVMCHGYPKPGPPSGFNNSPRTCSIKSNKTGRFLRHGTKERRKRLAALPLSHKVALGRGDGARVALGGIRESFQPHAVDLHTQRCSVDPPLFPARWTTRGHGLRSSKRLVPHWTAKPCVWTCVGTHAPAQYRPSPSGAGLCPFLAGDHADYTSKQLVDRG